MNSKSISIFDKQYKEKGLKAQRLYPNESLIQFIASKYFNLSIQERKNIKILEVGCGTGANLWMLAKEGFSVHGIDSSQEGIDLAINHLAGKWGVSANLQVGLFTEIPYESNYFDAVVDVVSLQHLDLFETNKALSEIARVLKISGEFFSYRLSDHSIMYQASDDPKVDSATLENISDQNMPLANNGKTSFWSPALAREMYDRGGLSITSIERVGRTYNNGMLVEYLAINSVLK